MSHEPLRVITFNFLPFAYDLLTKWIHDNKHKHVLAVTTPGPTTRPTPSYIEVVKSAPRNVDVLVTTRLRNVATPLIRELKPDLIMSMTFPYRLTPEILSIPRIGAINLHPAVLPAYRGPNVFRPFYEGWHEYGVTVHRMDAEFDTGNILSQRRAPMPDHFDPELAFRNWITMFSESLDEGMIKAIAGDAGTVQDDSEASYAAPFTDEEKMLDLTDSRKIIRRKCLSLNMMGAGMAKVRIDGKPYHVMELELVDEQNLIVATPDDSVITVQASDGALRLTVQPLADSV